MYEILFQNESTDEEGERVEQRWSEENVEDTEGDKLDSNPLETLTDIPENATEIELPSLPSTENFKKVLELSSDQLVGHFVYSGLTQRHFSANSRDRHVPAFASAIR